MKHSSDDPWCCFHLRLINRDVTLPLVDLFTTLADPIRREIVQALAAGPLDAGTISGRFPVSRPAISRHLKVLRECGLVTVERDAQRRIYRLDPHPLEDLDRWLDRYRSFWADRLDRLTQHVEENP